MDYESARFKQTSVYREMLVRTSETNPEQGLALTSTHPGGSTLLSANVDRDAPIVLAADFLDLDGSDGGVICHFGSGGLGAYCGFRENGDFVLRAGDGAASLGAATGYLVDSSGTVSGDGRLVVEINVTGSSGSAITVRVWWRGQLIPGAVAGTLTGAFWSGDVDGLFYQAGGDGPDGEFYGRLPKGELISGLRHYSNQTSGLA